MTAGASHENQPGLWLGLILAFVGVAFGVGVGYFWGCFRRFAVNPLHELIRKRLEEQQQQRREPNHFVAQMAAFEYTSVPTEAAGSGGHFSSFEVDGRSPRSSRY